MKQTAVEWLINELHKKNKRLIKTSYNHLFDQAKEMEKEQIVDAFVECWKENMPDGYECKQSADEYYNQTYGGKNE